LAPFGVLGTVSSTVTIILFRLAKAKDVFKGIVIVASGVSKRKEGILLATFPCLCTLAPFRLLGAISSTVTIVFLGLVRAKDHWCSICTAFLGFLTCTKVGISSAISLTITIITGWLPRTENGS